MIDACAGTPIRPVAPLKIPWLVRLERSLTYLTLQIRVLVYKSFIKVSPRSRIIMSSMSYSKALSFSIAHPVGCLLCSWIGSTISFMIVDNTKDNFWIKLVRWARISLSTQEGLIKQET